MCVVSMIVDKARDYWKPFYPLPPYDPYPTDPPKPSKPVVVNPPYNGPTKEQVEELIDLLKKAKQFDKATNQPDCEMEDKKKFIRELAKHFGIDIAELKFD